MDLKVGTIAVLVVVSIALAPAPASGALYCPPDICESRTCPAINKEDCERNGRGMFVPKGDSCGCCPICVTFLDEGSECYLIADSPQTQVCREPMFCIDNKCTHPPASN